MAALARSTACPDWQTRIVKGQTLIPFAPIFHQEAVDALETFGALKIVDEGSAANAPTFGDVARPWVNEFVAQIFGAYDSETGIRHITEFFMLISKKNGKSTLAAGIMLTALILNWRDEAEFIILSPTIEIANNSFRPAAAMVRADPELSELLSVQDHIRTITHRVTGATLKVVAADTTTVSGKKAVGVLVDELWLFGKDAKADAMLMEATGGLASRPEGFVIYLTTQSDEPPAGVFKDKLEYARSVRDGTLHDPQFLPLIYEFPMFVIESKGYLKPENFYITNPNLKAANDPHTGSVNASFIEREIRKAQQADEGTLRKIVAKHLNVEIGLNLRADRWRGAEHWQAAAKLPRVTIGYLIQNCEVVTGGVDGGGLDDLLGAAMIGREKFQTEVVIPEHFDETTGEFIPEERYMTQRLVAWMHAWVHSSVLKLRLDIASKLNDLAKAGLVTIVTRPGRDAEQLAQCFSRVNKAGLLYQIGFDPNAIGVLIDALLLENVESEKMVKVNQGARLAGSIKYAERKLWEGVLVHDGNALGNWTVGNAKVVVRGNGTYITKQVSGTAKIDPLIAVFNALDIMQLNPEPQGPPNIETQMVIVG